MALTINTKTFNKRTQSEHAVEFLESASGLNTPYSLRQGRTLPSSNVKNSVLRGDVRLQRYYTDASGNPRVASVKVLSSIAADAPNEVIDGLKADFKAAVAIDAAVSDVVFKGVLAEY